MIIPYGTASLRRHFPAATVAIIALNVIAFVATHAPAEVQAARYGHAAAKLRAIELKIEADYLTEQQARNAFIAGFFGKRTKSEEEFWGRFSRGQVVPMSSPEFKTWEAARKEEQDRLHEHVFYRWGFRNTNPNPLCILTSMFLHDGYFHVLGNMLFLWVVGVNMEESWGRRYFLLLYFLGGACATAAQAWSADASSDLPNIGASGAVASVMGAFMIRHFKVRIRFYSLLVYFGAFTAPAGVMLPIWFLFQLRGVTTSDPDSGGVAFAAHVGGFVLGAALALIFKIGRVAEASVVLPEPQVDAKSAAKDDLVAKAHAALVRGRNREALLELAGVLTLDPADDAIRRQKIEVHHAIGDAQGFASEGEELLRVLWRRGEKRALADAFDWLESLSPGSPSATFALRAATAVEADDPQRAAHLLWRAAQGDPRSPVALQALKRYATVLDKLGAAAQAEQVRALLSARERESRG